MRTILRDFFQIFKRIPLICRMRLHIDHFVTTTIINKIYLFSCSFILPRRGQTRFVNSSKKKFYNNSGPMMFWDYFERKKNQKKPKQKTVRRKFCVLFCHI